MNEKRNFPPVFLFFLLLVRNHSISHKNLLLEDNNNLDNGNQTASNYWQEVNLLRCTIFYYRTTWIPWNSIVHLTIGSQFSSSESLIAINFIIFCIFIHDWCSDFSFSLLAFSHCIERLPWMHFQRLVTIRIFIYQWIIDIHLQM